MSLKDLERIANELEMELLKEEPIQNQIEE